MSQDVHSWFAVDADEVLSEPRAELLSFDSCSGSIFFSLVPVAITGGEEYLLRGDPRQTEPWHDTNCCLLKPSAKCLILTKTS